MTRSFPLIFFKNILFQHKAHVPKEVPGGEIQGSDCVLWEDTFPCVTLASVPGSVLCSYVRFHGRRQDRGGRHLASAPMGSQAGRMMGSCSDTASTSSGTCFLSTTTSYTYSENHSSVMHR